MTHTPGPARKLVHYTPEAGDLETWLARWEAAGWVPEFDHAPPESVVNGRTVYPVALVRRDG